MIRDRVRRVNYRNVFYRVTSRLKTYFLLGLRLLYRGLLWLVRTRLNLLIVFSCSLFLIILIYFPMASFGQSAIAIIMLLMASIGLSFLDHKYGFVERELEENMMDNLRKQLAVGMPDEPKALPSGNDNSNDSGEVDVEELLVGVFKQYGYNVVFNDATESSTFYDLIYYLRDDKPFRAMPEMVKAIKEFVGLSSAPIITFKGKTIYLKIPKG